MTLRSNSLGLLVVGHGTPHDQGQQGFWTTVRQVAEELPETVVEGCFLEAAAPDIPTALHVLARQGLSEVVLVPLLLFSAGHAERDIPAVVLRATADIRLTVRQTAVLGCHPQIVALSAERFRTAVGSRYVPDDVLWLCVGRGSRDAAATAEMARFVTARLAHTPVGRADVAFLAMAEPHINEVVSQVIATQFPTVVVQPHLLYSGTLFSRLQRIVAGQDRHPLRQHWILAECLGCDRAVARVVVERYREATSVG